MAPHVDRKLLLVTKKTNIIYHASTNLKKHRSFEIAVKYLASAYEWNQRINPSTLDKGRNVNSAKQRRPKVLMLSLLYGLANKTKKRTKLQSYKTTATKYRPPRQGKKYY